jgi:hypothetical protein
MTQDIKTPRLSDDQIGRIWFKAKVPGLVESEARRLIRMAEAVLAQQQEPGGVCARCGGWVCDPVVAQPEQEPVAWMVYTEDGKSAYITDNPHDLVGAYKAFALYTHPPRREWRNLTMQEINALPEIGGVMWRMGTAPAVLRAIRAVEAALKGKNA